MNTSKNGRQEMWIFFMLNIFDSGTKEVEVVISKKYKILGKEISEAILMFQIDLSANGTTRRAYQVKALFDNLNEEKKTVP